MEPFPKRQRIHSPIGPSFPQSFDSEDVFYDDEEDDFIVEDEDEDDETEEPVPELDPESDFQQKRARLDYKLKSTFEAIFEKYGRNFDGVGDEIDLATGEIVVNNGHIMEMLDERDAGDVDGAQSVPTDVTEESGDLPSSIIEISDSDEDEEDEASDEASDGEMLEDDLILRGFALANRFAKPSPELGPLRNPTRPSIRPTTSHPRIPPPPTKISAPKLPSQAEILTQFGPQLGPKIVEYVSKQAVPRVNAEESSWKASEIAAFQQRDRNIDPAWRAPEIPAFKQRDNAVEPAWRAPELPNFKPRRQEVRQPVLLPPQHEPSPSPEETTSIWALPRKRGPRKKPSMNGVAHVGGESSGARYREERPLGPVEFSASMEDNRQASPVKKKRKKFTEEDDRILLNWVAEAKQQGLQLNHPTWRKLEAKHPHHSWSSWEYHYKHHFTYLESNSTGESEVSADESAMDSVFVDPGRGKSHRPNLMPPNFEQDAPVRPSRIRKPAQKDSRIISWSEAVDALESLDPEIHAGVMHDAGTIETGNLKSNHAQTNLNKQVPKSANTVPPLKYRSAPHPCSPKSPPREIIDLTDELTDHGTASPPERHSIPGAPCPHADCRAYPTATYRLQRRENEELSEMCLHLFRVHHTTPYPCGEKNCPRQFEEGFFMQADLVMHVRKAHPTIGALHRLRGRVDSQLLDRNIELSKPGELDDQLNRQVSQPRDSDFMSPHKLPKTRTNRSQQRSSSEQDHTPRASTTVPGMSRDTPMTSISSMRVHHSSAIKPSVEEEVGDDNLRYMKYIDDMSMRAQRSSRSGSARLGLDSSQSSAPKGLPAVNGNEKSSRLSNSMPTPVTATESFSDSRFSFFDDHSRQQKASLRSQQQAARDQANWKPQNPAYTVAETPEPAPVHVEEDTRTIPSTSSPIQISPKPSNVLPNMQRNILDPTYEFSDEEIEPGRTNKATHKHQFSLTTAHDQTFEDIKIERVKATNNGHYATAAALNSSAGISSMGPPSAPIAALAKKTPLKGYSKKVKRAKAPGSNLSFATPSTQQAIRDSILRMALDTDDFDELSLEKDDVVLLSSQPRLKPLASIEVTVKQEDVMNTPRPLPNTISKKRSFNTFRSSISPDELAAEDLSPSVLASRPQTEVKAEEASTLPVLPLVARKPAGAHNHRKPLSQTTPSSISRHMAIRNSTPLLDLTPARLPTQVSEEIFHSTVEQPSPVLPAQPPQRPRNIRQREAPTSVSSSPIANVLTPTRKPAERSDFLQPEQVTVVVKTPGGTYRRCGEDGFACGRSFCFRCGSGSSSGMRVGV